MMLALGEVIEKLDIRRAQVLVEAIIVETQTEKVLTLVLNGKISVLMILILLKIPMVY